MEDNPDLYKVVSAYNTLVFFRLELVQTVFIASSHVLFYAWILRTDQRFQSCSLVTPFLSLLPFIVVVPYCHHCTSLALHALLRIQTCPSHT